MRLDGFGGDLPQEFRSSHAARSRYPIEIRNLKIAIGNVDLAHGQAFRGSEARSWQSGLASEAAPGRRGDA
jgi:hypothetical protein